MKKSLSFAVFDGGETILGALVFSTFFPLYITEYVEPKIYSLLYGLSFMVSFGLALILGKIADRRGKRKRFFTIFGVLSALLCFLLYVSHTYPAVSLLIFLFLTVSHQQTMIFYNSLLLNFERKGLPSGLGVAFGYMASAFALMFLAKMVDEVQVYLIASLIFFLSMLPATFYLKDFNLSSEVSLSKIFKDRRFLLTLASILSLTEVANTLISMMGIYLREVYDLEKEKIFEVIGLSALGGVVGGVLWGKLVDAWGPRKVFRMGFFLWITFLIFLFLAPSDLLLLIGLLGGVSLAHVWTVSRVLVIESFPKEEIALRLSFLSLTERISSTAGLLAWSLFLGLTGDNFRLSALLMILFPVAGLLIYTYESKRS